MESLIEIANKAIADYGFRQVVLWSPDDVIAQWDLAQNEADVLAHLLKEYVPQLKSTSCLPKAHGYQQPPYEAIDEATYDRLAAQINHDHKLVNAGDIEIEECAGGACPIR